MCRCDHTDHTLYYGIPTGSREIFKQGFSPDAARHLSDDEEMAARACLDAGNSDDSTASRPESGVPVLVQSILIPHQLIEMFFQALGLCGYMLAVENVDESRNPVTKAWNRGKCVAIYVI